MVVFLSFTFFRLLCLGIIPPFPFLFRWHPRSCVPQILDDEIPEVACHGVARWSYTRKRKEYSARGTYRSKDKKRDVAGKFNNILTKSGANSSSCL